MRNILIIVGLLVSFILIPFTNYQMESVEGSLIYAKNVDSLIFIVEMNQPYFPSIVKSKVLENPNLLIDATVYMNECLRSSVATLKTNFNLLTVKFQSTFMIS